MTLVGTTAREFSRTCLFFFYSSWNSFTYYFKGPQVTASQFAGFFREFLHRIFQEFLQGFLYILLLIIH